MKYRFAVIFFIAAFILQTCLLGQLQIFGASANLILCCTVVISFIYTDNSAGLVLGAAAALIYDIAFSSYIGMTALPLAVTAAICIFIRERFLNREHMMSMVTVSAVSVIIYYHLYFAMIKIAGIASAYSCMLKYLALYLILNVIVMMIMYVFMIDSATRHKPDRYTKWAKY